MTLSELILNLQNYQAEYGDMPVEVLCEDPDGQYNIPIVEWVGLTYRMVEDGCGIEPSLVNVTLSTSEF